MRAIGRRRFVRRRSTCGPTSAACSRKDDVRRALRIVAISAACLSAICFVVCTAQWIRSAIVGDWVLIEYDWSEPTPPTYGRYGLYSKSAGGSFFCNIINQREPSRNNSARGWHWQGGHDSTR